MYVVFVLSVLQSKTTKNMEFDLDKELVTFSSQCSQLEISQFSTKTLNDYSIVSRKLLDQIVDNTERRLTEDEHRWLIKRDCSKVISHIKKFTRKKVSKNFRREETNYETVVGNDGTKTTLTAVTGECVVQRNRALHGGEIDIASNALLDVDPGREKFNLCNIFVENTFAVINVRMNTAVDVGCGIVSDNAAVDMVNDGGKRSVHTAPEHTDAYVLEQNYNDSSSSVGVTAGTDLERIYWKRWRAFVDGRRTSRVVGREGINTACCSGKSDSFLSRIQGKLRNAGRAKEDGRAGGNKTARKPAHDRQSATIEEQRKLLEKQRTEIERLRLQQLKLESEKAVLENEKALHCRRPLLHRQQRRPLDEALEKKPARVTACAAAAAVAPARAPAGAADMVRRMEMRALERRAKWEAVRERRRHAEQEEQRRKRDLEEKSLREEMGRKRERLFEARENARLKRIEERRRQTEMDAWREKVRAADDFRRRLMIRDGLEAFRANLRDAKSREQEALNRHSKKTLGVCFSRWRLFVNNNVKEKLRLAEKFYQRTLMKKTFLGFLMILEENMKKKQVAEDWHSFKTQEFWFVQWLDYTKRVNTETHRKMLEAESYHNRTIMKRCFVNWRKFPEVIYKERLKDRRLRLWHEKVQEIIPDFVPPEL